MQGFRRREINKIELCIYETVLYLRYFDGTAI